MHLANQIRDDEAGSTLLEMALCTSIVLLVILAVMECSLAVYTEHYVEAAAANALRYATVRGSTYSGTTCASTTQVYCEASSSAIQNYIRTNAAPGVKSTSISVAASWPGTSGGTGSCSAVSGNDSPGCVVTVTVTYPFTFMLPAPSNATITFHATRSTVISQ